MSSNRGEASHRVLHIFVLAALAVAQPLLDLISRHAEFLVAYDLQPPEIVALVLLLCLLLPLAAALPAPIASRWSPRAGRRTHLVVLAVLVATLSLTLLRQVHGVPGSVLVVAALGLGLAAALGYTRSAPMRSFLTFLSPAIVVIPVLFLFFSPVRSLLFPISRISAQQVEIRNPVPVVMVLFDELSLPSLMDENHQIDASRYPSFARLARSSYWFRNATTVSAATTFAVPAILTGNYPRKDRLPTFSDYPDNLFSLLSSRYAMVAYEFVVDLCPRSLCGAGDPAHGLAQRLPALLSDLWVVYLHVLLPPDLTANLPAITGNWKGFRRKAPKLRGGYQGQYFQSFVDAIGSVSSPPLYYIHLRLPHAPWKYLPSGNQYEVGDVISNNGFKAAGIWGADRWPVLQSQQRYLLQLGYCDLLLGRLIDKLIDVGLYEKSLLVVTADHGIGFSPNEYHRNVNRSNFSDVMPVPLLIKLPGQREGVVNDRNVETIDILPTIAEVLEIERLPWTADGQPLLDPSVPERRGKSVFRNSSGSVLRIEGPVLEATFKAADRMLGSFGSGSDPERFFAIGPDPEWIGRPASEGAAAALSSEVRLDWPEIYAGVGSAPGFVPALITGRARLEDPSDAPLSLLVAVNGTIRATTRTFTAGDRWARFKAMVPESSFSPGRNTVEAWVVPPRDDGWLSAKAPSRVFADGFETGNLERWSGPEPGRSESAGLSFHAEPWADR